MKGTELDARQRIAVLNTGLATLEGLEKRGQLAPRAAGWPARFRKAIADLK